MSQSQRVPVAPQTLDEAVWRPSVPLAVLTRCPRGQLIVVWLGLRWLRALFPRRASFSTREIARAARVNRKYVTDWLAELAELRLVERQPGAEGGAPRYALPLHELERQSLELLPEVLQSWGVRPPERRRAGVASIDPTLAPIDTSPMGSIDSTLAPIDSIESESIVAPAEAIDSTPAPIDAVGRKDGRKVDGGKVGSAPITNESSDESNLLEAPPGEPALSAHPLALWRDACPRHRPIDARHIQLLAAEHDPPTGGHGLYWVGRAILAAALLDDVRVITKVRTILNRWRAERAYGSDLPGRPAERVEHSNGRIETGTEPTATQRDREAVPGSARVGSAASAWRRAGD